MRAGHPRARARTSKQLVWQQKFSLVFVLGGTQVVNANFSGFQDLASTFGFDDDSISATEIISSYSRATSEELCILNYVD